MKILVPIKRVADPDNAGKVKITSGGERVSTEGLSWDVNPFDLYGVEAAIRLTENGPKKERIGEVVVMTLGPSDTTVQLRRCLAMGAEKAIRVDAEDEKIDSWVVARTIAAIYEKEKPHLVIMGKQTVDTESNQVAQLLARLIGLPQATFVAGLNYKPDDEFIEGVREVDGGILNVRVNFPAIISVNERIIGARAVQNGVTPEDFTYPSENVRYTPLPMIKRAERKPLDEYSFADLGVDTTCKVEYLGYEAPPARKAGEKVETVEELIDKLKNEARVLP